MDGRKLKDELTKKETSTRPYVYVKRGYIVYISFAIGVGSSVGIWYKLVGFDQIFPNIVDFAVVFLPTLIILSWALGRSDYDKGTYQVEAELARTKNPVFITILDILDRLSKTPEVLERIITILERIEERLEEEK